MERNYDMEDQLLKSVTMEIIHEKASGDIEEAARDRMWEHELPRCIKNLITDASLSTGDEFMTAERIEDFSWIRLHIEFFRRESHESSKRTEMRLKVLGALGNCQTLKEFDLYVESEWNWSMCEWKALLVPLQTIAVQLETIVVGCLLSPEEEVHLSPLWNKLLRQAHNLADLVLHGRISPELAAEVASGLGANLHHKLKCLSLNLLGSDARIGVHLAAIISCAPYLEKLTLLYGCPLDAIAREALSRTLKRCRHLRKIKIFRYKFGTWSGMWEVLADAYTESSVNPILESLEVIEWINVKPIRIPDVMGGVGVRTAAALGRLILGNVRSIRLDDISSKEFASAVLENNSGIEGLGQSLLHAPCLKAFVMDFDLPMADQVLEKLDIFLPELWRASNHSHLLDICFDVYYGFREVEGSHRLVQKALADTYLQRLRVFFEGREVYHFRSLVDSLVSNTSVFFLHIFGKNLDEDMWRYLFNRMRDNSSIRILAIDSESALQDENFRDMMYLLQVNFILEEVDVSETSWAKDGKGALIDQALERNKRHAGYLSVLQRQNLAFGEPRQAASSCVDRPLQLKVTMMKTMSKKSTSESVLYTVKDNADQWIQSKLGRTKGIEVELLCDNDNETISIWDLAGQEIFRALQNLLFPRITGRILPQILVIVTHEDTLRQCGEKLVLKCFERRAEELRDKYKGVVDLCPIANDHNADLVYHVNATSKKDVKRIKDLILSRMENLLETKSPRVPKACSQLVSRILQRGGMVDCSPVLPCEDFYRFCSTESPLLKHFDSREETGRRVLHAAASYLHDAGAVFMTPSARLGFGVSDGDPKKKSVVIDLNWLTQNLLGELASHGHGFEIKSGPLSRGQSASGSSSTWLSDSNTTDDGFIDPKVLYSGIERILEKKKGVDIDIVVGLLFELDLCYKINSVQHGEKFFMPMIFGRKDRAVPHVLLTNKLSWVVQHSSEQHHETWSGQQVHFGFRIQCQDNEKMAFNHGFYPRFQIHLRKHMDSLGVLENNFIFSRYHVKIMINGCTIFVEIDPAGENHVDILVQFSKDKTKDWAMNYVQENVVQKLIKFSASNEGCPAVQLNVAVLRTQCVQLLIPRTLRDESQAVSIEELKRRFKADIESQLENGESEDKMLFGYMYAWPEIKNDDPCFSLAGWQEPVERLLSFKEFSDVVVNVRKTHEDIWQNRNEINEVSRRLSDLQNALDMREGRSTSISTLQNSSRQRIQESESIIPEASLANMTDGERVIHDSVVHLGEKVDQLKGEIRTGFEHVRNDLRSFKSTIEEMLSQMSRVESSIDTIIGYTLSKEIHRTPNRPYFRFDVSLKQKVTSALLFGKPVRLHLMCEARGKPHFIKDQEGLELSFGKEDKFSRSMRTLSVISMKMIWVLLKIGAQVTAGLGSAVPDFSCLASVGVGAGGAAANIALDRMSVKTEMDKNLSWLEHADVHEAWCCLRDHLADKLNASTYASLFKLHLVRYRKRDDPYAWLCPSCVSTGRRNFFLEP